MEDIQKAAGYIRIDDTQYEKHDIDAQKEIIQSYAKNHDINIAGFFIDHADAAVPLDKRDGYQKLSAEMVSGNIDAVITFSFDTFTNDEREKQGLLHQFAEKGIEILLTSTGKLINPSNPITREQRLLAEAMRDMEDIKAGKMKEKGQDHRIKH